MLKSANSLHAMVCDKFKIPEAKHEKKVLRFKGLNSYLFGNSQLIYFEELRHYLR
jgi:hypothetical protein